eukprot:scpid97632/ scgid4777/ 
MNRPVLCCAKRAIVGLLAEVDLLCTAALPVLVTLQFQRLLHLAHLIAANVITTATPVTAVSGAKLGTAGTTATPTAEHAALAPSAAPSHARPALGSSHVSSTWLNTNARSNSALLASLRHCITFRWQFQGSRYVSLCMYLCVCISVYVSLCMYLCVCISVYVSLCMYLC